MPVVRAPRTDSIPQNVSALTALANLYGTQSSAFRMGRAENERKDWETLLATLAAKRKERAAEKAAEEKEGGFAGIAGAGGGAIIGGLLAAPTGGLSIPVGAAIGGGLGGVVGGGIDTAMGNQDSGSRIGGTLLNNIPIENPFFKGELGPVGPGWGPGTTPDPNYQYEYPQPPMGGGVSYTGGY